MEIEERSAVKAVIAEARNLANRVTVMGIVALSEDTQRLYTALSALKSCKGCPFSGEGIEDTENACEGFDTPGGNCVLVRGGEEFSVGDEFEVGEEFSVGRETSSFDRRGR